jgi:hypothetical protein
MVFFSFATESAAIEARGFALDFLAGFLVVVAIRAKGFRLIVKEYSPQRLRAHRVRKVSGREILFSVPPRRHGEMPEASSRLS